MEKSDSRANESDQVKEEQPQQPGVEVSVGNRLEKPEVKHLPAEGSSEQEIGDFQLNELIGEPSSDEPAQNPVQTSTISEREGNYNLITIHKFCIRYLLTSNLILIFQS